MSFTPEQRYAGGMGAKRYAAEWSRAHGGANWWAHISKGAKRRPVLKRKDRPAGATGAAHSTPERAER